MSNDIDSLMSVVVKVLLQEEIISLDEFLVASIKGNEGMIKLIESKVDHEKSNKLIAKYSER